MLVLSLVFIFSVVALHSTSFHAEGRGRRPFFVDTPLTKRSQSLRRSPGDSPARGAEARRETWQPCSGCRISERHVKANGCWREDDGPGGHSCVAGEGLYDIATGWVSPIRCWGIESLGTGVQYSSAWQKQNLGAWGFPNTLPNRFPLNARHSRLRCNRYEDEYGHGGVNTRVDVA